MEVHQCLQILGVPGAAGLDEAKWAYKRLAIRYHPDKSREANAAEHFKRVSAAYADVEKYARRGGRFPVSRPANDAYTPPSADAPPTPCPAPVSRRRHAATGRRPHRAEYVNEPPTPFPAVADPRNMANAAYEEAVARHQQEHARPVNVGGVMFGSQVGIFAEEPIDLNTAYAIFDRVCAELEGAGMNLPVGMSPPGLSCRQPQYGVGASTPLGLPCVAGGGNLPGPAAPNLPAMTAPVWLGQVGNYQVRFDPRTQSYVMEVPPERPSFGGGSVGIRYD